MIEAAKSYTVPAVATATPRLERRSSSRPWSKAGEPGVSTRKRANAALATAVVQDVKNDNEWREF
jgi:hypothetical protein